MFIDHFDFKHPLVCTIDEVLSRDECAMMITALEAPATEWLAATVNGFEGRVVNGRVRNNTIAMIGGDQLGPSLFEKIRDRVPAEMSGCSVVGLKDRLRCYRYATGEHFGLHHDQAHFAHDVPGHPERPDRVAAIYDELDRAELLPRFVPVPERVATETELRLVHHPVEVLVVPVDEDVG